MSFSVLLVKVESKIYRTRPTLYKYTWQPLAGVGSQSKMSGQGPLQVPLCMETPNDTEASPMFEWPKNAKEPRPKKRKRVPARPIRHQCKKKMKYAPPGMSDKIFQRVVFFFLCV